MEASDKERSRPALDGIAVLIPAWKPDYRLVDLAQSLAAMHFGAIVVVNDGSGKEYESVFARVQTIPSVVVLKHAVNLGKGRALKTGINYCLNAFTEFAGLVTVDADGQHSPADILRVANVLQAEPERVVMGCRSFGRGTPLRSSIGNTVTRTVFHFVSGDRVSDTQSGLRAFPTALLPELLTLPGERYEFEMTVLARLCREGHRPLETPISTIYIDNNRSSSFNPIRDSMRIYFVLLRFYASSLFSAALDLAGFCIAFWFTRNVLISIIVGRVSSLINFALNRSVVFHNAAPIRGSIWRYYLLATLLAIISYSAIRGLSQWLGWNIVLIKVVVETSLSLVSFSVQKTLVFADRTGQIDE